MIVFFLLKIDFSNPNQSRLENVYLVSLTLKEYPGNRRVPWENYFKNGWTYRAVLWFLRISWRALSFCLSKVFFESLGSRVSIKPCFFSYRCRKKKSFVEYCTLEKLFQSDIRIRHRKTNIFKTKFKSLTQNLDW